MAINFPNAPILNQTFSSGNNTYIWNGSAWVGYSTVTSGGGGVTVSSQWVTAAAGIHTSSNVGVGTTNATSKLTVQSTGSASDGENAAHPFAIKQGTSDRTLWMGYATNIGGIGEEGGYINASSTGFSRPIYLSSRNQSQTPFVGIGTDRPTGTSGQMLQVNGGAYVSGNLGIGSANPTSKLTVQGTLSVSGVSTFNNTVNFGSSGSISTSGNNLLINANTDIVLSGYQGGTKITSQPGANLIFADAFGGDVSLYFQTGPGALGSEKRLQTLGTGVTVTGTTFTNQLSVSGVSTFKGSNSTNVHLGNTGYYSGLTWSGSSGSYGGTEPSILTNSGLGLDISGGLGDLILSAPTSGGDVILKAGNLAPTAISCIGNAQVEINHNGSKKFETLGTGVTITGTTFTNQLSVSGVSNFNGLVGLGVTNPTSNLHVDGNGRFTGVVTATTFIGDGSGLTNIVATGTGIEIRDDGSVIGTASTINFGSNISVSQINAGIVTVSTTPITTLPELSVTGIATLGNNSRVSGYFSASQLNVSTGATFGGSSTGFLEVKDNGFSKVYIAPGAITFNDIGGIQQIGTTQFFRASFDGSSLGAYYFSNYYGGFDHKVFYIDSNGATEIYYDESKKLETTSTGIVVTGVTTTNTLSVSGNSTISGNTSTNNLSVSNNVNVSGIVTANSFVGDGSQLTGISAGTLGVGTFAASIGVTTTIHTYAATNLVAEYTLFFQYNSTIQSQKVMVMNNGSTAYAQEYAIMYEPSQIVSVGATVSGSNVLLQVTPKSGITGITTFKYLAQVIS